MLDRSKEATRMRQAVLAWVGGFMNKFRGKKHYIMTKAWQRSSVGHLVKSRCRHAKRKTVCGYRYKGGR